MINIIGAGMAGSIMAKLLRERGVKFRMFDARKPGAASQISENLIGLNWYKDRKADVSAALATLKRIVPIRKITSGLNQFYHVYTSDLLEPYSSVIEGEAKFVHGGVTCNNVWYEGLNIICCGFWSHGQMTCAVGHSIEIDQTLPEFVRAYKPYRQLKLINNTRYTSLIGNSLAVSLDRFERDKARYYNELLRIYCETFPNLKARVEYKFGLRPVAPEKGPIFTDNGIIITGGYKSGMIDYPLQCEQVLNYIKKTHYAIV